MRICICTKQNVCMLTVVFLIPIFLSLSHITLTFSSLFWLSTSCFFPPLFWLSLSSWIYFTFILLASFLHYFHFHFHPASFLYYFYCGADLWLVTTCAGGGVAREITHFGVKWQQGDTTRFFLHQSVEIVGAYMLSVHILNISKFLLIVINSWSWCLYILTGGIFHRLIFFRCRKLFIGLP